MAWRAWCVSVGDRAVTDSTARRWSDREIEQMSRLLNEHVKAFSEHRDTCSDQHNEVHVFITKTFPAHAESEDRRFSRLEGAFPRDDRGDSDLIGHKQYHDAQIKAAQAQEEFWRDLKSEVAKKGTIGLLVILLGLIAAGAAAKFGINFK